MLLPRMHLQLLKTSVEREYLYSVAGVFNIAVALAYQRKNTQRQAQYETAQTLMATLIREMRVPSAEESNFLYQCFNQADRYIGIQTKIALIRAIELVDKAIETGEAIAC
jgi:hypothetical protein